MSDHYKRSNKLNDTPLLHAAVSPRDMWSYYNHDEMLLHECPGHIMLCAGVCCPAHVQLS